MNTKSKIERTAKRTRVSKAKQRSAVGASIIKGLEQAIAWSRGEKTNAR